jgi:hypothetical protein
MVSQPFNEHVVIIEKDLQRKCRLKASAKCSHTSPAEAAHASRACVALRTKKEVTAVKKLTTRLSRLSGSFRMHVLPFRGSLADAGFR